MTKRERKTIQDAGPFDVDSCANGELKITPEWPKYPIWNEEDGGGPGLGSRWELASIIGKLLNEQEGE